MLEEMKAVARAMVAPGKGILAADESFPTIEKRFKSINVASTEATRSAYRGMMFSAVDVEKYISGVILFDETLRQKSEDGTPFVRLMERKGILPGIKVDKGAKSLPGFSGEKFTVGLDDLRERLAEYKTLGAKFAKWRSVITIGAGIPSQYCLEANARGLAHYAALCQEAGIVPIVEPEVLMDADNSLAVCQTVTEAALQAVFNELAAHRVQLEAIILKPNMVISGKKCADQASIEEVARATVETLRRRVPAAVPGIAFLSGGQSDILATAHLNAMNRLGELPWELSFSYGRALQEAGLNAWAGKRENIAAAQEAFMRRARCNSAARYGKYNDAMETA